MQQERKDYLKNADTEEVFNILQYILYIFNATFFIFGAIVFAFGMHVTFDNTVGDYTEALSLDFYLRGAAVLIAASTITILNALIGSCGVFQISRRTLFVHIGFTAICFVMLLSGSIYLLVNGLENTNMYPYIQDTMKGLIYRYNYDMEAKTFVDRVQENINCCGGDGIIDYISINIQIPDTCRDHVTGNQHDHSCAETVSWYFEFHTGWMCGVSLGICFLQIFETIATVYTYSYISPRARRNILFRAISIHER